MTCKEYKQKIIELFKSGNVTKEQWDEMAEAVLIMSENYSNDTYHIDSVIDPESVEGGLRN